MISLARQSTPQYAASASTSGAFKDNGSGVINIGLPALLALRRDGESLPLKASRVLASGSGSYRSPFRGRGMEFDEVRPYMQGDDVRTLDWRVTARTGRAHTKLFREERERAVIVWLDLRSTMFFATRGAYKAVRAAQAAALLGWSAAYQGDRVGGLIFSDSSHAEIRPNRGKAALLHLLNRIADYPGWQDTPADRPPVMNGDGVNQSLARLRRVAQPGSMICLLSDFSGLNEQGLAHLAQLSRHNDVILSSIHDPLEAELPPPGHYRVGDGQRFATIMADDNRLRAQYRQRFIDAQAKLQQLCVRHAMHWLPLTTAENPLGALRRGLGVRP